MLHLSHLCPLSPYGVGEGGRERDDLVGWNARGKRNTSYPQQGNLPTIRIRGSVFQKYGSGSRRVIKYGPIGPGFGTLPKGLSIDPTGLSTDTSWPASVSAP
jgi:hypothetical protein